MSDTSAFKLTSTSIIDFRGADASAIVHNLTTNEVKSLQERCGCETFITDVKGKTLGHVMLYRMDDCMRMIGPAGQSSRIAEHADRYTIREDAEPIIRDEEFVVWAVPKASVESLGIMLNDEVVDQSTIAQVYPCSWLGLGSALLVSGIQHTATVEASLAAANIVTVEESEFHRQRVEVGFPWYGVDLNETNLPQEADRDANAISFTKGCYLGQETVARLDAMGQVQKKLVRWKIEGATPESGTPLVVGDKTVGRLTSVVGSNGGSIAIGMARRSHFEPGSTAQGKIEGNDQEFEARVI